jgi:hypothetical protein
LTHIWQDIARIQFVLNIAISHIRRTIWLHEEHQKNALKINLHTGPLFTQSVVIVLEVATTQMATKSTFVSVP